MSRKSEPSVWRSAWVDALGGLALGWDLGVPICGGTLLGHMLDRHFQMGYVFTLGLMVLGVMVGFYNVARRIRYEIERDRQRAESEKEAESGWEDSPGSSRESA